MPTPITVYAKRHHLVASINASALNVVDGVRQDLALQEASAEMDSYFRAKYTLPFVLVGADVRQHCVSIALYRLLNSRGRNPDSGSDSWLEEQYDRTIAWLKGVASGKISPDVTDSSPIAEEGTPSDQPIVISASQRGFTSRGTTQRLPFQGD